MNSSSQVTGVCPPLCTTFLIPHVHLSKLWCVNNHIGVSSILTLKIPRPHFPSNYRLNANWHKGFNGIFCSLFAFSESSCWWLWVVQVWPEPYMSSEWLNPRSWAQNAGGKSGAKMLPCVSLANSCQLARRGILRVNDICGIIICTTHNNKIC